MTSVQAYGFSSFTTVRQEKMYAILIVTSFLVYSASSLPIFGSFDDNGETHLLDNWVDMEEIASIEDRAGPWRSPRASREKFVVQERLNHLKYEQEEGNEVEERKVSKSGKKQKVLKHNTIPNEVVPDVVSQVKDQTTGIGMEINRKETNAKHQNDEVKSKITGTKKEKAREKKAKKQKEKPQEIEIPSNFPKEFPVVYDGVTEFNEEPTQENSNGLESEKQKKTEEKETITEDASWRPEREEPKKVQPEGEVENEGTKKPQKAHAVKGIENNRDESQKVESQKEAVNNPEKPDKFQPEKEVATISKKQPEVELEKEEEMSNPEIILEVPNKTSGDVEKEEIKRKEITNVENDVKKEENIKEEQQETDETSDNNVETKPEKMVKEASAKNKAPEAGKEQSEKESNKKVDKKKKAKKSNTDETVKQQTGSIKFAVDTENFPTELNNKPTGVQKNDDIKSSKKDKRIMMDPFMGFMSGMMQLFSGYGSGLNGSRLRFPNLFTEEE